MYTTPHPVHESGGIYPPHPPGITPVVASHNRRRASLVIMGGRLVGHNNKKTTHQIDNLVNASEASGHFVFIIIYSFIYLFTILVVKMFMEKLYILNDILIMVPYSSKHLIIYNNASFRQSILLYKLSPTGLMKDKASKN